MTTLALRSNLGASFELGPDTIRRRDDKGAETVFALDNITRVRALVLGGGGVLELASGDQKMVVVSSREVRGPISEAARREYIEFVTELHRRLIAKGHPVEFVGGMIFKRKYDPRAIPPKLLP